MEAVSMPVVAGATEKELARLHELEDLIGQQRVSYEARLAGVCREKERVRQDCETSLAHVRQEMGELKTRHLMEKESELHVHYVLYSRKLLQMKTFTNWQKCTLCPV